jgi:peptide/nickel transport system substrate-binding protein
MTLFKTLSLFGILFSLITPVFAQAKHGIAMLGEPALDAHFKAFPYVNPHAPKGGHISYGVLGTFDNLNPFILKSMRTTARGMIDSSFGNLVFESLMARNYDEPFSLYGLLAHSVETDARRSFVQFELNPSAKWSDGQFVTPQDVIFTFETFKQFGRPPFSNRMDKITKIEQIGEYGVKFTFNKKSDSEFPLIIALTPIIPKHATKHPFDQPTLTPMIGSGPYVVDKVNVGARINFMRNPNYWGKNIPSKQGFDNFNTISIDYFKDETTQFEAFKKGLFDIIPETDPIKWEQNYNFDAVKTSQIKKESFVQGLPSPMYGFVFNTRRPIFFDPQVRKALTLLYDFEWTNKNLFANKFKRTESFWQNSQLSALGIPASKFEKKLLEPYKNKIAQAVMDGTWHLPKTNGSGRDRIIFKQAIDLLYQAHYTIKDQKMFNQNGKQLSFEILCSNGDEEKLAMIYQRSLTKIGIAVRVRTIEEAQYQHRRQTFDYDMILATFSASLSPGVEQVNRWGSTSAHIPGTFNYAGVTEDGIDVLIDKIGTSKTTTEFNETVRALDRLLIASYYIVPLHHLREQWLSYDAKLVHPKTALFGYQLSTWWVKK